jgi:hypothetical protein
MQRIDKHSKLHIGTYKIQVTERNRFEDLTPVDMSVLVLWIATPCGFVDRHQRRLGGVAVSVFATERKGRGFKPSRGDRFLRAIKSAARHTSDKKQSRRSHVVKVYGIL